MCEEGTCQVEIFVFKKSKRSSLVDLKVGDSVRQIALFSVPQVLGERIVLIKIGKGV